jgi:hypothetical protein
MPSSHIPSHGTWRQVSVAASHVSVVHAMPSSHAESEKVCRQPADGSQVSMVQSLSSSHAAAFGAWTQPLGVHVSTVHAIPSSHAASDVHGGPPVDELELDAPEEAELDEDDDDALAPPPWPGAPPARSLRAPQPASETTAARARRREGGTGRV